MTKAKKDARRFYRFVDTDNKQVLYLVSETMGSALEYIATLDLADCEHCICRELSLAEAQEVEVSDSDQRIRLSDAKLGACFSNLK